MSKRALLLVISSCKNIVNFFYPCSFLQQHKLSLAVGKRDGGKIFFNFYLKGLFLYVSRQMRADAHLDKGAVYR